MHQCECNLRLKLSHDASKKAFLCFWPLFSGFIQAEATFTKTAMDKVQSSYLRSLQEIGELLKKRADTLKSLKIWALHRSGRLHATASSAPNATLPSQSVNSAGLVSFSYLSVSLLASRYRHNNGFSTNIYGALHSTFKWKRKFISLAKLHRQMKISNFRSTAINYCT